MQPGNDSVQSENRCHVLTYLSLIFSPFPLEGQEGAGPGRNLKQ